jgi:hypothetical protein
LDDFKIEHRLTRTAHYPDVKFFNWSILAFALTIETLLNGFFFSKGSDLGLVGGLFQAFIIALINVAVGYVVGAKALPYWFHKKTAYRVLAGIGALVYVAFIVVGNLGVGHYREAYMVDPDQAAIKSLASFLRNPLGLELIDSWMLFILGMACSLIALSDAFVMDDRYPGYGKLTRRFHEAELDYVDEKKGTYDRLEAMKAEMLAEIDVIVKSITVQRAELKRTDEAVRRLVDRYDAHSTYLEQCCNGLLTRYRSANQKRRNTAVPRHFAEAWEMDATLKTIATVADAETFHRNVDERIKQHFDEIDALKKAIFETYTGVLMKFHQIADIDTVSPTVPPPRTAAAAAD